MKLKLFYSWQSDIDFNNQSIRDALKLAIIDLEKISKNPRIDSTDSTSNLVGSTRIPDSILRDISTCDIFVCDLTIVGRSEISGRKIPNPNVLIELGYALSELGWHRTIVVFNEYFGEVVKDLPFDIEKRSTLTCKIENKEDSNGRGQLKTKLRDWIQKIITENPSKPSKSSTQYDIVKRKNDVKNLKQFLKFFEIGEMDLFFKAGRTQIARSLISTWVEYKDFASSKEFYMYDQDARNLLSSFLTASKMIDELLKDYVKGSVYYRRGLLQSSVGYLKKSEQVIRQIEAAYEAVLNHIRLNYFEIKITKKRY